MCWSSSKSYWLFRLPAKELSHAEGSLERGTAKVQACTFKSDTPISLKLSTSHEQVQYISLCRCHVLLASEAESHGVTCLSPARLHACTSQGGIPESYCPPLLLCTPFLNLHLPEVVGTSCASQTCILSIGCLWHQEVCPFLLCVYMQNISSFILKHVSG